MSQAGETRRHPHHGLKVSSGGRIFCNAFIRNYLATIITLPKRSIPPLFLKGSEWGVALVLEPIDWKHEEFSKSGSNAVAKDALGVYELLGNADVVLRIGEGKIRHRINAHLQDSRFAPPTVKSFRYLELKDAIDSQLTEKILIEEHENSVGVLPRFQEIRA